MHRLLGSIRPVGFVCVGLFLLLATSHAVASKRFAREAEHPGTAGVRVWTAPRVDVERLKAEDEVNRHNKNIPWRVGKAMKTDLTPANSGNWRDLSDGARVWRLDVESDRALWLVLGFTRFELPPGAELRLSDGTRSLVLGPFTAADRRPHGQLWTPPIPGTRALVELRWPAALADQQPGLRLGTVSHGYRPWGGIDEEEKVAENAGASGSCNIDVHCPEGQGWENETRAVVRLLSGGTAFCTGSLVNNSNNDCTPYVVTAAHCNVNAPSTTFQFNYERSTCNGGAIETSHTLTGATLVSAWAGTDFALLRLDDTPPAEFDAFYAGWNRSTAPATRSTGIHHPRGDVKKISHNTDTLVSGGFDGRGWGSDHWRVTEWEQGTTEPSSSGSPLYDQNRLFVGQLHGGAAECGNDDYDEYGKFTLSWNGGGTASTRMRDWLDPLGSNPLSLQGIDRTVCEAPVPVLGVLDSQPDDSIGNGDGILDPGEPFRLWPMLINTGNADASAVGGTLTTSTAGVNIGDDTAGWPDLLTDSTAQPLDPFSLQLDGDFACGTQIALQLHATSAEKASGWISEFVLDTGLEVGESLQFGDSIEGSTVGWSPAILAGNNPWQVTTFRSHDGARSWYVNNAPTITDSVLAMQTLNDVPPGAQLTFWHLMNSEGGFDGGVLEIQSGTSWIDAGNLIVSGQYNVALSTDWSNPLGGRLAWSGNFGGWRQVVVDLSSLAGTDVKLRWRFATDTFQAAEGWYLDEVRVTAPDYQCTPWLTVPGEVSAPGSGATPFRVERLAGDYRLSWSSPANGGPVERFVLYSRPLGDSGGDWTCEGDLGTSTTVDLSQLPSDRMFVVVARNAAGDGSYGRDSSGGERPAANQPCP